MRRALLLVVILALQFVVLEGAIRWHGGSEVAPEFRRLFMQDPRVGHRLRPDARARFTTVEFSTDLAINAQGVRDDEPIGPKAANERRVIVLGDSLVLSVQVPFAQTFCELLEARLNAADPAHRWRVINAGVQGYGPVHEWLFFNAVASEFEPDIVLIGAFVGNDAVEANDTEAWLDAGRPTTAGTEAALNVLRRLVRSSVVLQLVRMRWDLLRGRFSSPTPERPVSSYLADPPPDVLHGLDVSRRAFEKIARRADELGARAGLILFPARFQTDDGDYGRLNDMVHRAGGVLIRNAATARFREALAPLGLPTIDLLPILEAQPDRIGLFYQRTIHFTPRGHELVSGALFDFLMTSGLVRQLP
ncbi:MAG TPA: hypothetical protein VES67_17480 [Vicinamibacterales bacterium]|nr:hypothetical protein [Vicinamibacterales bacterium]